MPVEISVRSMKQEEIIGMFDNSSQLSSSGKYCNLKCHNYSN